jgi:predicted unusual protein kinase regulating ubiquinone biosynthesis (AarF/ABC1/UbiB family)
MPKPLPTIFPIIIVHIQTRKMPMTAIQRALCRRPAAAFASTTFASIIAYANYVEHDASSRSSSSSSTSLPRDRYDPSILSDHWGNRPLSVMRRLSSIFVELSPIATRYLYEYHALPRLLGGDGGRGEMEIELSIRLRESLARLGPTFVKVGQQLSIRPDLISPRVLYELQKLCDAVPPFDDNVAMRVLAEELATSSLGRGSGVDDGRDSGIASGYVTANTTAEEWSDDVVNRTILRVFEEMPVLVASASLGQVYKATMRSNTRGSSSSLEVAIKIQRPDILDTVSLDLYLLVTYGKLVDGLFSVFTNQIPYHETFLNGFANGAYMEMNYVTEAMNQAYFRSELHSRFHRGINNGSIGDENDNNNDRGNNESPTTTNGKMHANEKYGTIGNMLSLLWDRITSRGWRREHVEKVIVPMVYDEYTTERILVTEWIDGIPLARAPPEQIRSLIPVGVELFLVQLLDIGRFHGEFG